MTAAEGLAWSRSVAGAADTTLAFPGTRRRGCGPISGYRGCGRCWAPISFWSCVSGDRYRPDRIRRRAGGRPPLLVCVASVSPSNSILPGERTADHHRCQPCLAAGDVNPLRPRCTGGGDHIDPTTVRGELVRPRRRGP